MSNLHGKVAMITGAASKRGMGHAIALRLASEGAKIVILDKFSAPKSLYTGDTRWAGLDTLASEIQNQGQEALAVVADVSNSQEVDGAITKALERFGKIDILVHAASIRGSAVTPIIDLAEEDWKKVLDINLNGTFLIAKAVAKSMITKEVEGKIVLISSMGGVKPMPRSGAYCASKFGVIGLMKTLALELVKYKIYVNAINPGAFATNLRDSVHEKRAQTEGISVDEARERDFQEQIAGIPLGRMGTTEEIANLVLFLVSDQNTYITAEAINISGGIT